MSNKTRLVSYVLFVVGAVLLTGALLFTLHTNRTADTELGHNVPQTIADFALAQVITGQNAVESIQQLHGKDFRLVDGVVATYGDQNATLWVSDAGSVSAAADLTELMKTRIAEGNSPFVMFGDFDLDGFTVYALEGIGQAHYYWQVNELVLWLAVDVDFAEQAVRETVAYYQ